MQKLLAVAALSILVSACTNPAAEGDGKKDATASAGKGGFDKTGAPVVKGGLWEVTTGEGTEMANTVQLCVDDPLESDRTYLQADAGDGCAVERKEISGGLQQVTRCEAFGLKTVIDLTFRGGSEAFEIVGRTAAQDGPAAVTTRKARRIGACPAGMEDGEAVGAES